MITNRLLLLALSVVFISLCACGQQQIVFPPVLDAQTRGYCGSCHMAYQPAMLPAASWRLMMAGLDDHFREKVTLQFAARQQITQYLETNAGDQPPAGEAGRVALQGLDQNASLQRITSTPYFKREHSFLENRILDDWVGSLANCTACHVGAWVGDYKS